MSGLSYFSPRKQKMIVEQIYHHVEAARCGKARNTEPVGDFGECREEKTSFFTFVYCKCCELITVFLWKTTLTV